MQRKQCVHGQGGGKLSAFEGQTLRSPCTGGQLVGGERAWLGRPVWDLDFTPKTAGTHERVLGRAEGSGFGQRLDLVGLGSDRR